MEPPKNWSNTSNNLVKLNGYRVTSYGNNLNYIHKSEQYIALMEAVVNNCGQGFCFNAILMDDVNDSWKIIEPQTKFTDFLLAKNHLYTLMEKYSTV